jgi:hypothetical protein
MICKDVSEIIGGAYAGFCELCITFRVMICNVVGSGVMYDGITTYHIIEFNCSKQSAITVIVILPWVPVLPTEYRISYLPTIPTYIVVHRTYTYELDSMMVRVGMVRGTSTRVV